ncbi:MAG TPA: hypothetical protein PLW68_07170 [Casimicrobiaceae bacterium]|nr:hypothetical protein [Casimicrobiaceae bacterium]
MRTSFPASAATATIALALTLLSASWTGGALAGVYKCVNDRSTPPGTNPIYQDTPCPPGKELRNFDAEPAEVSVIPHQEFVEGANSPPPKAGRVPHEPKPDRKKESVAGGDAAQRKFIAAGMSEAEVVARIGNPDITGGAKGRKSLRWSYLPVAGDPQTITTITFESGRVTQVERKVVH